MTLDEPHEHSHGDVPGDADGDARRKAARRNPADSGGSRRRSEGSGPPRSHDDRAGSDDAGDAPDIEERGEILLVGDEVSTRLIAESLEAEGYRCTSVGDADSARRHLLERRCDVVVLDLDGLAGRAFDMVQFIARISPATLCILRSRTAKIETVIAAMRAGIGDYFVGTLPVPQLRRRIAAAVRRARDARGRLDRAARLASLCRILAAKRSEGTSNNDDLASLLEGAGGYDGDTGDPGGPRSPRSAGRGEGVHDSTAGHDAAAAPRAGTCDDVVGDDDPVLAGDEGGIPAPPLPPAPTGRGAAGFEEAAQRHLDPEQLVAEAIEHLAGMVGPVNVAVYLGTGSCRFGLAAYARSDLPRLVVERALVRWSEEACTYAAFEGRVHFLPRASLLFAKPWSTPDGTEGALRDELARRPAVVVPCRHEGICDAVFIMILPIAARAVTGAAAELAAFGTAFAKQLQRIQRIHSRLRPSWPPEAD